MSEYKTIPSHSMFEINDEETMDKCVRSVKTKEYLKVRLDNNGYPRVYLKKTLGGDGKYYKIHRLVVETYIGDIPEGMECDHINCDRKLFVHTNLRIVNHKENMNNPNSLINNSIAQKKSYQKNPERKIIQSINSKKFWENADNRIKQSEYQKKRYENIEERKKLSESSKKYWSNEENRKKASECQKKRYENIEEHLKTSNCVKKWCSIPENIKKKSDIAKKMWENPEHKQKCSESMKKVWEDSDYKERLKNKLRECNTKKRKCIQIDKDTGEIIAEYSSTMEARRKTGIYHISDVCIGKRPFAGGFKWKYKE